MPEIDLILSTNNNAPDRLADTLLSIFRTTFKDIRLILVNDSNTSLQAELRAMPFPIEYVNLNQNCGLTMALKAAEKHISADYIARIDCGDIMEPTRLEKQIEYLRLHPPCILLGVATRMRIMDNGSQIAEYISPSSNDISDLKRQILYRNPFVHGSVMIRSKPFFSAGGYDSVVKTAQDIDLYLRLRNYGDFFILKDILQSHIFSINSSITVKKNKTSVYYTMRSRLKYLSFQEKCSLLFIFGLVRDLVLFLLPGKVLAKLRIASWRK